MKRFEAHKMYIFLMVIMGVFVSLLSACGGGGGGSWTQPGAATPAVAAPAVTVVSPLNGAVGVFIDAPIRATFSETMDPATISAATFTVQASGPPLGTAVGGAFSFNPAINTVTFKPAANLAADTVYTATITTGAKNPAGKALAQNHVWTFTTGLTVNNSPPTVTNIFPADASTGVLITTKSIYAEFSKDMDQATINLTTFTVQALPDTALIGGTIAYDAIANRATFSPTASLTPDTQYTVTVTAGAKDLSGAALAVPAAAGLPKNPWTFRTAAAVVPPASALAINLGKAASFGIASRAGLTSTGVTVVNGDIALSPLATCSDATGNAGASQSCLSKIYSSPTGMSVNGSIFYAGDPFDNGVTAAAVTTDLTAAWNEGMAKVNTQPAIAAGEIGGKTFVPGIYENANLTLAAGATATLDAQNDPNAVFIFKTTLGGDFVDSGTLLLKSRIVLLNQAQAKNVWFVIGRDATIGSGTTWNGNILANRTVTLKDGSTVLGRVLGGAGGAGAITLTGAAGPSVTTITVP